MDRYLKSSLSKGIALVSLQLFKGYTYLELFGKSDK